MTVPLQGVAARALSGQPGLLFRRHSQTGAVEALPAKGVALGRKNYMFVGNERGGRAAAIYYSLMESCKANKVNPLTYMVYLLSNVRNKGVTLLLPDEFQANNLTQTR